MHNGTTHVKEQELQLIQVKTLDELLGVWSFVKKGIDHIKHRDKSCGSWTHSQIFNAVKFGLPTAKQKTTSVELFVAYDTEPRAFMVTTPHLDPFMNNAPCGIHVWLLYANAEMVEQFLPALERLGKIQGGDQIRFESGRFSWLGRIGNLVERHFETGWMGKLGFRVHQIVYTKDIQW